MLPAGAGVPSLPVLQLSGVHTAEKHHEEVEGEVRLRGRNLQGSVVRGCRRRRGVLFLAARDEGREWPALEADPLWMGSLPEGARRTAAECLAAVHIPREVGGAHQEVGYHLRYCHVSASGRRIPHQSGRHGVRDSAGVLESNGEGGGRLPALGLQRRAERPLRFRHTGRDGGLRNEAGSRRKIRAVHEPWLEARALSLPSHGPAIRAQRRDGSGSRIGRRNCDVLEYDKLRESSQRLQQDPAAGHSGPLGGVRRVLRGDAGLHELSVLDESRRL
mmetsp:Transcript_905/g.3756  ORF Transcript_905/g.3756 Transcript_905/m.3756 type:complete len:275 (+) Transcript_905:872-1696(+)